MRERREGKYRVGCALIALLIVGSSLVILGLDMGGTTFKLASGVLLVVLALRAIDAMQWWP